MPKSKDNVIDNVYSTDNLETVIKVTTELSVVTKGTFIMIIGLLINQNIQRDCRSHRDQAVTNRVITSEPLERAIGPHQY